MSDRINDFKRMIPILAGYGNGEINKDKLLDLTNEDLAKKIGEKKALSQNNGHKQKVVSIREVRYYIEDLDENTSKISVIKRA